MSDHPIGLQGRPFPYHVKNTYDHWWPKGLQRLWPDENGFIYKVDPDGIIEKKKPPKPKSKQKGFGWLPGGHRVCRGISPWNRTFEPHFDRTDSQGISAVQEIALHLKEKKYQGDSN